MSEELNPCPLCGSATRVWCDRTDAPCWVFSCDSAARRCPFTFRADYLDPPNSRAQAIEAWNSCTKGPKPAIRAGDPVVVVKAGDIEALRSECKNATRNLESKLNGALQDNDMSHVALHSRITDLVKREGDRDRRIDALEASEAKRMDPVRREARMEVINELRRLRLPDFGSSDTLLKALQKLEICR